MTMQHSIQDERNILLRPHTGQFVIDELPLMFVCMAGLVYGGMEGLPLSSMARIVSLFLLLVLLYRFIYLRRIRYRVGEEQLVSEHGIFIDGSHSLDGPEHAKARPYRRPMRKRHRGDYP